MWTLRSAIGVMLVVEHFFHFFLYQIFPLYPEIRLVFLLVLVLSPTAPKSVFNGLFVCLFACFFFSCDQADSATPHTNIGIMLCYHSPTLITSNHLSNFLTYSTIPIHIHSHQFTNSATHTFTLTLSSTNSFTLTNSLSLSHSLA